jgi:hypothetical protein
LEIGCPALDNVVTVAAVAAVVDDIDVAASLIGEGGIEREDDDFTATMVVAPFFPGTRFNLVPSSHIKHESRRGPPIVTAYT